VTLPHPHHNKINIIMNTSKDPSIIGFLMISGGLETWYRCSFIGCIWMIFFLYIRVLVARYHFQLSSWEFHDFNNHIKFHD
jgi:hypothetical protein